MASRKTLFALKTEQASKSNCFKMEKQEERNLEKKERNIEAFVFGVNNKGATC